MGDQSKNINPPIEKKILVLTEDELRLFIRALEEYATNIKEVDEIFIHALPFEDLEDYYEHYAHFLKGIISQCEKSEMNKNAQHELALTVDVMEDITHNLKIVLVKFFNQNKSLGYLIDELYEKMRDFIQQSY